MDAREKTDKHIRRIATYDGPRDEPPQPKRDMTDIRRVRCGGGFRIIRKPIPQR